MHVGGNWLLKEFLLELKICPSKAGIVVCVVSFERAVLRCKGLR